MEPRDLSQFMGPLQRLFREDDPAFATKTLEQSHIDEVETMFAQLSRGDMDAFLDCMTDDVEIEISAPSLFPWKRRAKGREEMRALVEYNFSALWISIR